MYLIRNNGKKNPVHIWTGTDTACRMWSSGGIRKEIYRQIDNTEGRRICHMCEGAQKNNPWVNTDGT